ECTLRWPVVNVGDRHLFQPGASGGLEPHEYLHGSERVSRFLERQDAPVRGWNAPPAADEAPEAEWGFAPPLLDDVRRFADLHGYRVRRIVFVEPEDPSALVADLYRWTYGERRLLANRLLATSFILMDPLWTLRTGSVPWWA